MTPGTSQFSSSTVTSGSGGSGRTATPATGADGVAFLSAFRNMSSIRCVDGRALAPSFLDDDAEDVLFALVLLARFTFNSADVGVELKVSVVVGPGDDGSIARARVESIGIR